MSSLHLFEAYGIELEYMIVQKDDLSVLPLSDIVLQEAAHHLTTEVELGEIAWSNEFVLHVIELKTNGPRTSLDRLSFLFHEHIRKINSILGPHRGRLIPTGAHPLMDPHKETRLWPHEYNQIYETY
ncbi:MAG: glutamate--cysteine ligase, partial [Candidatus Aureabacteria bacterium]|nr:glutamate--cysteine ligase [Candidatus Auribacterota bacterium]